jgi:hypothetical protein
MYKYTFYVLYKDGHWEQSDPLYLIAELHPSYEGNFDQYAIDSFFNQHEKTSGLQDVFVQSWYPVSERREKKIMAEFDAQKREDVVG